MYPQELLPVPGYKLINSRDVLSRSVIRLLREAPARMNDALLLVTLVDRGVQPKSDLFELSVFLRGILQDEYFPYCLLSGSPYTDYWNPGDSCMSSEEMPCDDPKASLFPCDLSVSRLLSAGSSISVLKNGAEEHYRIGIEHKPTRCNFWHFQLYMEDSGGNRIPRKKSGAWVKDLVSLTMKNVFYPAIETTPNPDILPASVYCATCG